MTNSNIILDTDSYKTSHFLQYPADTTALRAYFEARTDGEEIRFFGLQYILKKVFETEITMDMVEEAKEVVEAHGLPFPYEGWKRVVEVHNGKLPLHIRAVPEGTVVPSNNVLFMVESTDPELPWLVTWMETVLVRVWYPTTVATRSYDLRKFMQAALEQTSDNPEEELPFKLHDFGSRGVSSSETAGIGGMGHLINFLGTDTIEALMYARRYYGADMAGFSIPASEHSTMTTWGDDGEVDAMRNMIEQFGGGDIFACVSDSYDIYNAVENIWGDQLKQEVIDMPAMLVVRPDSGDPFDMVMYCVETLGEKFGYTTNSKGYKVLNNVRVIQGDGVDPIDIKRIISGLIDRGWAMDNIAFGMGGGLLQRMNRDTHKFAYKVCEAKIDGEWVPVYKEPVGQADKVSKAGNLDLVKERVPEGEQPYRTINRRTDDRGLPSELVTVYHDGFLTTDWTWDQVTKTF